MIVLTAEEAEKVRGASPRKAGHVLVPVPLKDGRFMLGEEALEDETHADVRDFLASLPRAPIEKLPVFGPDDVQDEEAIEPARLSVRSVEKIDAASVRERSR